MCTRVVQHAGPSALCESIYCFVLFCKEAGVSYGRAPVIQVVHQQVAKSTPTTDNQLGLKGADSHPDREDVSEQSLVPLSKT